MRALIAVLPGDGIGPEVVAQGVLVLKVVAKRFGHRFEFQEALIGGCAIDRTGQPLPPETLALCRRADAVLLGAVGGPKWDDPRSPVRPEQGLLAIRKGLGLFANLRPVRVLPSLVEASTLKPEVLSGVDLVVVRELTGGLYFGRPQRQWRTARGRRVVDTLAYTEQEIERILRVAFELARGRRQKLTSVDKANILESSRLWRQIAIEVAQDYPDVQLEHLLVDACAMHLIRRPASFDVIVTENMFGDILTDEAAMLVGSMGMLPSASLGARVRPALGGLRPGLYEPIHGSAPDIAGQDKANPIATILSCALLLRHSLGLEREAQAVERAVEEVLALPEEGLAQGYRTQDILPDERLGAQERAKLVGTREMGALVAQTLSAKLG